MAIFRIPTPRQTLRRRYAVLPSGDLPVPAPQIAVRTIVPLEPVLTHKRALDITPVQTWTQTPVAPDVTPVTQTEDVVVLDGTTATATWAAVTPDLTSIWAKSVTLKARIGWIFPNPVIATLAPGSLSLSPVSRDFVVRVPSVFPVVGSTTGGIVPLMSTRTFTVLVPTLTVIRAHPPMDDDTTYRVRREVYE